MVSDVWERSTTLISMCILRWEGSFLMAVGNTLGGNQSEIYELILYVMCTHILELLIPILISDSLKDIVYVHISV
jgi:hypothetical protein